MPAAHFITTWLGHLTIWLPSQCMPTACNFGVDSSSRFHFCSAENIHKVTDTIHRLLPRRVKYNGFYADLNQVLPMSFSMESHFSKLMYAWCIKCKFSTWLAQQTTKIYTVCKKYTTQPPKIILTAAVWFQEYLVQILLREHAIKRWFIFPHYLFNVRILPW